MPLYFWQDRVRAYLREHFGYFAMVALLFGMGIIFGSLTVNNLDLSERQSLQSYLLVFLRDFHSAVPVKGTVLAHDAVLANLKTLVFLLILGITAVGAPFILLVVFTRGFVLGFTVGFLVKQLMAKGFFLALLAVVPHNLILVPALLVASVANIDFGLALIKSRLTRRPVILSDEFLTCLTITAVSLLVLILAGLVEGFVSPVMMRWMARYIG